MTYQLYKIPLHKFIWNSWAEIERRTPQSPKYMYIASTPNISRVSKRTNSLEDNIVHFINLLFRDVHKLFSLGIYCKRCISQIIYCHHKMLILCIYVAHLWSLSERRMDYLGVLNIWKRILPEFNRMIIMLEE